MKGIIGYIFAIAIVGILTVVSFYLLSELMGKEIEVSTISSKVNRVIGEIEFSKIYFKKYFENEIKNLKSSGANSEYIIKNIKKVVSLELENSKSNFEVDEVRIEDDKTIITGAIKSFVDNKDFQIKAEYKAEFTISNA
jgi:hypothetical protein